MGQRNCSIVPLRQEIVKDNAHVLFEIGNYLASNEIDFVDDMHKSPQTGLGVSLFHQFFYQCDAGENDALTGTGDMRE